MPRKPKPPNPFPMSDHAARARAILYSGRIAIHINGCLCDECEMMRRAFVAGWQACRKAGRAKRKAVKRGK